jgi:hypothetical protein
MDELKQQQPRATRVSSGNPRITVSFPFSKIDIHEPTATLAEVAALVARLAEQVAALSRTVAADDADAADQVAEQAKLLVSSLGAEAA